MAETTSNQAPGFYAALRVFDRFADVHDPTLYSPVPADWDVVVTDVEGSTQAIEAGRYKDVNALGVASIVALRNALPEFDLPFVFGGDGATVLTPSSERTRVHQALRGIRVMAKNALSMTMRASMVSIEELSRSGSEVGVARFGASPNATFAMFSGSGLSEAERLIKDPVEGAQYAVSEQGSSDANFDGFECRWKPLQSRHGKVISVLVQATAEDRSEAALTYRDVLQAIAAALDGDEGRPVASDNLNIASEGRAFNTEARISVGKPAGVGVIARTQLIKAQAAVGRYSLARGKEMLGFPADVYLSEVVANTDFRKFDDTLRMVLDVTDVQHRALEADLARRHASGSIVYGVHAASAALMTCAITNYKGDHVHFVDGADGGYALAAKQLKAQRKA